MSTNLREYLSFLIKPASWDCNLFCDYCFYKRTVESYPESTHRMSEEIFSELACQAQSDRRKAVSYVFQGGEPMLMGLDFYKRVIDITEKHRKPGQVVTTTVQTNGILIDDQWADFFARNHILVGISLDGPKELHDMHRFNYARESVYERVMKSIDIMRRYGVEFNILTVITKDTAPHADDIYDFFRENELYYLQFIDCYENDPDGNIAPFTLDNKSWGDFLCRMFDRWFRDGYPNMSIRLFDNLLQYYVGMAPECCMYKDDCGGYFVIEHNGDVYTCDFFVTDDWHLGNISETPIDKIIDHPKRKEFHNLRSIPCTECESCEWLGFCLRGCPKSRFFPNGDYSSLSFLCEAYKRFFEYSKDRYRFLAWDIIRRRNNQPVPVIGRNDPCVCGSGKKYKKCCEKYSFVLKR